MDMYVCVYLHTQRVTSDHTWSHVEVVAAAAEGQ